MDFIKNTLNQINIEDDNLYDIIYDLFFIAKLKDSANNIENGRNRMFLNDFIDMCKKHNIDIIIEKK